MNFLGIIHGTLSNGKTCYFGDFPMHTFNADALSPFTKDQIYHLLKLLKFNSSPNVPVGIVAQTSKCYWVLSLQNHFNPWIIDLGTSEHMINSSHLFRFYFPSFGFEKVG